MELTERLEKLSYRLEKEGRCSGRNDLGIALGVIRALRDGGYLNMEKFR